MHLGRIEFNIVFFMDWSFASGCSPPRLSTTQLPSATDGPVFPSDRDFHPTVGAYSQAHFYKMFHFVDSFTGEAAFLEGRIARPRRQSLAMATFFMVQRRQAFNS